MPAVLGGKCGTEQGVFIGLLVQIAGFCDSEPNNNTGKAVRKNAAYHLIGSFSRFFGCAGACREGGPIPRIYL